MNSDGKQNLQFNNGSGLILISPKYLHNLAAAIRAASCFDVTRLIWTGSRFDLTRLTRLPREERMKGYRDVLWSHDTQNKPLRFFQKSTVPVCIELLEHSEPLTTFEHPESAVYVFGPEDGSVPQAVRRHCHRFVHIQARHCLNLAAAINVVLHDRKVKRQINGREAILPTGEMLKEHRGPMDISFPGFDGY